MSMLTSVGLVLLTISPLSAQTILTPYFIDPPTSGCNGLGAFGPASTLWQPPCAAPYTYLAEPDGCAQGPTMGGPLLWFTGDTIYVNLCSTPCSITIYDTSGECVTLCQIPVSTEVLSTAQAGSSELLLTPGPILRGTPLRITLPVAASVEVSLVDMQGRMVHQGRMSSHPLEIATDDLSPGVHLVQARWNDGRTRVHRFIVE